MTQTELELIAARDHDVIARFYDRHVAMVGEFCAAVCPDQRVDEAVAAVFLNFLGRASEAPSDADPEELLRIAAREIAASRMEPEGALVDGPRDPVCKAMPELLAARVNGVLGDDMGRVADHLSRCPTCQATAARLGQADVLFPVGSAGRVTELRAEWLELAGDMSRAAGTGLQATTPPRRPGPTQEPPRSPTGDPEPAQHLPARGRVRRGGLIGAVRRLAGTPSAEARGAPLRRRR